MPGPRSDCRCFLLGNGSGFRILFWQSKTSQRRTMAARPTKYENDEMRAEREFNPKLGTAKDGLNQANPTESDL